MKKKGGQLNDLTGRRLPLSAARYQPRTPLRQKKVGSAWLFVERRVGSLDFWRLLGGSGRGRSFIGLVGSGSKRKQGWAMRPSKRGVPTVQVVRYLMTDLPLFPAHRITKVLLKKHVVPASAEGASAICSDVHGAPIDTFFFIQENITPRGKLRFTMAGKGQSKELGVD